MLNLCNIVEKFLCVTKVVGHVGHPDVHLLQFLISIETARRGRLHHLSWLGDVGNSIPVPGFYWQFYSARSRHDSNHLAIFIVESVVQHGLVCQS